MSDYPEVSRLKINGTHYDIKDYTARDYIDDILGDLGATTINNTSLIGQSLTNFQLGIQDRMENIADQDIDQIFYNLRG